MVQESQEDVGSQASHLFAHCNAKCSDGAHHFPHQAIVRRYNSRRRLLTQEMQSDFLQKSEKPLHVKHRSERRRRGGEGGSEREREKQSKGDCERKDGNQLRLRESQSHLNGDQAALANMASDVTLNPSYCVILQTANKGLTINLMKHQLRQRFETFVR